MNPKFVLTTLSVFVFVRTSCSKDVSKRGVAGVSYAQSYVPSASGWNTVSWSSDYSSDLYAAPTGPQGYASIKSSYHLAPSPGEIAAAISAAKDASAAVADAQKRVQAAKDEVLAQQQLASHKEAEAALALQRAEAAAAVHRQQASAAANAVILAQQRLAQAKAEVAEKQRIAAAKEAEAAAAIQQNAVAAAAQVQKSDYTAAKLARLQSSGTAATLKHAAITKEATLGATSAALAATKSIPSNVHHPWQYHG